VLESTIIFASYFVALLYVAGPKTFYLDLLRGLWRSSAVKDEPVPSAQPS
jgi:hypothetical protein